MANVNLETIKMSLNVSAYSKVNVSINGQDVGAKCFVYHCNFNITNLLS